MTNNHREEQVEGRLSEEKESDKAAELRDVEIRNVSED